MDSETVHVNGDVTDSVKTSSANQMKDKLSESPSSESKGGVVSENGNGHANDVIVSRPDPTGTPDELSCESSALENSSGSTAGQGQTGEFLVGAFCRL